MIIKQDKDERSSGEIQKETSTADDNKEEKEICVPQEDYPSVTKKRDRAMAEFGRGSLRAETNQQGTNGLKFEMAPALKAVSMDKPNPEALTKAKLPVPDFWVYDGAQPTIGHTGHMQTDRMQILPNKRIREYDVMDWQRVGSKKGWMFQGKPLEEYGHMGEHMPTHTTDGWIEKIPKYTPIPRSEEKQTEAIRQLPAIDIQNRARGIGATSRGGQGMAGGYQHVTKERLDSLPVPMAKYNWTGTRLHGTGREDQGIGHGAGGYRSGYKSVYPARPSYVGRSNAGRSVGDARDQQPKSVNSKVPVPVLSKPNIR